MDRLDRLRTICVSVDYAVRRLRSIRSVLIPKGSSSSAPATTVVGSGTGVTFAVPATMRPVGLNEGQEGFQTSNVMVFTAWLSAILLNWVKDP